MNAKRWRSLLAVGCAFVVLPAFEASAQSALPLPVDRTWQSWAHGLLQAISGLWSLQGVAALGASISAWYALYWTYRQRKTSDELFARVNFSVDARFLGEQDGMLLTELSATLENKGIVPLKIRDFTFKLRGISSDHPVKQRADGKRGETEFPHDLASGHFVPPDWEHSFVYPGVTTEYNFVTAVPANISFIRLQSRFVYFDRPTEDHYAARAIAVMPPRMRTAPGSALQIQTRERMSQNRPRR